MSTPSTRDIQEALNTFTGRYVDGVPALRVDGELGPATRKRIRDVKYWLGYEGKRNSVVSRAFRERLWHPKDPGFSTRERVAEGARRRSAHNREWGEELRRADGHDGVVLYDGVPCAAVLVPVLNWCRTHGWHGVLVSGWRSPVFSESLCLRMCGAARCPGRCAGRGSNHSGRSKERCAADVSEYAQFGRVVARCPREPKLHNALGARDPVHYSPSGS
jgi:hypothetical protein